MFTSTLIISLLLSFSIFLSTALDTNIVSYNKKHATELSWRPDEEVRALYEEWMVENQKYYNGLEEKERKFQVFGENLKYIDYRNSQNLTFKLGLTRFADLTNEEYRSTYVGGFKSDIERNFLSNLNDCDIHSQTNAELPESIDWRDKDAVTPVKHQGQCESCWAFSAVAATEAINKIVTGNLISLSEQQIVDCEKSATGCKPGFIDKAFDFIVSNGINTDKRYPYISTDGSSRTCNKEENIAVIKIDNYCSSNRGNEAQMKAIVAQQPASGVVEARGRDFQLHISGIFDGTCGTKANHAITIVGYGSENGVDYWLMKNSWGEKWGDKGYIKFIRGKGKCGINDYMGYPIKTTNPAANDIAYV